MADVFISYKSEDRGAAEFVASQLSKSQISAWWDASLVAGETFSDAIRTELRSARAVVVLWSKASWASRWVQAEAQVGLEKGALVAARLDDVVLEPPFNVIQTADLRDASGVASLIAGVARVLGGGDRSGYDGSAIRFRGGPSRRLVMALGAAIVIALAAASGLSMWRASNRDLPAQIADIDAPLLDGAMKRGASFEVRFNRGSFWLNAAADEIARRFAVQSDEPPDRVIIQSTCRLQTDQKLEDDRATAVFVAIRRGGIPAEAIEARSCDLMVAPSVPPGAVRVSAFWSSEAVSEQGADADEVCELRAARDAPVEDYEGKIAINPQSGERIQWRAGEWHPFPRVEADEWRFWTSCCLDRATIAGYRNYLSRYPHGALVSEACRRVRTTAAQ